MKEEMLRNVHQHILDELRTNTKTDTTFVITSIVLNVAILITNASIAGRYSYSDSGFSPRLIVLLLFVLLAVVINAVAEIGLVKGRQSRSKLISGLVEMYEDTEVDKYYDRSLLDSYRSRYNMFMLVVLCTGLCAVVETRLVMV